MKHKVRLNNIFGGGIGKLLNAVKKTHIEKTHLRAMADEMDVRETFDRYEREPLVFVLEQMLDEWYKTSTLDEDHQKAQEKLRDVLEESHCSPYVINEVCREFPVSPIQIAPTEGRTAGMSNTAPMAGKEG